MSRWEPKSKVKVKVKVEMQNAKRKLQNVILNEVKNLDPSLCSG